METQTAKGGKHFFQMFSASGCSDRFGHVTSYKLPKINCQTALWSQKRQTSGHSDFGSSFQEKLSLLQSSSCRRLTKWTES